MKILCLFCMIIVLCGCSNDKIIGAGNSMQIHAQSVFEIIEDEEPNTYILDVREEEEYRSGHLKNAYHIPLFSISEETVSFIPKNSKVIVYCQSGNRSKMASQILTEMGYTVYDMIGGITNWNYEIVTE